MESKKYIINGKVYIQKALVIGQAEQMMHLLEGVEIQALTPPAILQALGGKLPMAAAIVLTPEGEKIRSKDLSVLEDEFAENLDFDTALEVAADFLSFNPISSISRKFRSLIEGVWEMIPATEKRTGSTDS